MPGRRLIVELDEKKIDAIFAPLDQCQLPGAAVGIALGGKPVYRKGFGLASMELPIVLSPSIRMRIGSVSKHFTCLAYLLLCEERKAHIDDPIGKYLPELHPVARGVSMRQLMGHVSGLRDASYIRWQFSGMEREIASADLLSLYRDIGDVNFTPGTSWAYNNGGFQLLSAAIERIAAQSLEEVFQSRIFQPVGMHDTLLRRFDGDFVPNSATMHMKFSGAFDRSYLAGPLAGEGGIVSTVDDMLRWLAHIDAPVIGSSATWDLMKAPQTLTNGCSTGYGLGLISDRYRGVETLSHAGGVRGSNAQMLKVPGAGLDIVVMVNRHDVLGVQLANEVLDACLPGLDPRDKAAKRSSASGIFRSQSTGCVIQLVAKEGRQIASIGGLDQEFAPDAEGVLRPVCVWGFARQTISLIGDPAKPHAIRFSDFGNVDELVAVESTVHADNSAVAGQYRADAIDTEIGILALQQSTRLKTTGRFGSVEYELECLADGIWRTRPMSKAPVASILSFTSGNDGFAFLSWNTRPIRFRRILAPTGGSS